MSVAVLLTALLLGQNGPPRPEADEKQLGVPFRRYAVKDAFGRTVTFYLSVPPEGAKDKKLPLVLFVQGSGCQSAFRKQGDAIGGGQQSLLLKEAKGRARVMVVEKPGVRFLDAPPRPGTAQGASEEFLKEHTLSRWAEANVAALRAARAHPDVDLTRALVVGHSEGGIVAARVASEVPEVTHVASLAGGGPTQLFSLAEAAARPRTDDNPGDAERRVRALYAEWEKVRADPDSVTRFWMAHPYRRWSSFLQTSVTAELMRTKARIFVAAGTLDAAVPVSGHDVLVAELKVWGRDVTAERLEGADHGFRPKDAPQGSPEGMQALLGRVLEWFLDAKD